MRHDNRHGNAKDSALSFPTARRPAAVAVLLCSALPVRLLAQEPDKPKESFTEISRHVEPGEKVRVHRRTATIQTSAPGIIEGQLTELSAETGTLVIKGRDGVFALDYRDIRRIELGSPVTKTHGVEGAVIGVAAGFGIMAGVIAGRCGQPEGGDRGTGARPRGGGQGGGGQVPGTCSSLLGPRRST